MRSRVWLPLFFCALFACAVRGAAFADDLPAPGELRVRIATAEGPAPTNYRETIVGHGSGGDVRIDEYHLDGNWRRISGFNGIHVEDGEYHGEPWSQNENGITTVDDPLPDEPHTVSVSRSSDPDAYVLADVSKDGYGTRTYVEPGTGRVLRVDEKRRWGTATRTNLTFATFGKQMLPATWTVSSTEGGKTSTASFTRTAYVTGDVVPDQIAEPPTPDIVAFPPGVTRADLPVTFDGGSALLHANVGGRDAVLELDSGAGGVYISEGLAKRLGLKTLNVVRVTIARQVDLRETIIPELHIGPLVMKNVVAEVLDLGTYGYDSEDFGLIGFDFLATLAVRIDYLHRHVYAESGWDFHESLDGDAFPVDINLSNRVPVVSATINGAPSNRLIVDTGGGGATLLLFDYFYRQHPEVFDHPGFQQLQFYGAGGHFDTKAYFFHSVKLGRLKLENFNAYRTDGTSSYPWDLDGIFGQEFLQHFTVDFDYVHGQMVLRENHDGGLLPAAH